MFATNKRTTNNALIACVYVACRRQRGWPGRWRRTLHVWSGRGRPGICAQWSQRSQLHELPRLGRGRPTHRRGRLITDALCFLANSVGRGWGVTKIWLIPYTVYNVHVRS